MRVFLVKELPEFSASNSSGLMNHASANEFHKRPESLTFWCRLWQFEFPVQMAGCCHIEAGLMKLEMPSLAQFITIMPCDQSHWYLQFSLTLESVIQSGTFHDNCKTGTFWIGACFASLVEITQAWLWADREPQDSAAELQREKFSFCGWNSPPFTFNLGRVCLNISLCVTEEQGRNQCEEFKIQLKPQTWSCFCLW